MVTPPVKTGEANVAYPPASVVVKVETCVFTKAVVATRLELSADDCVVARRLPTTTTLPFNDESPVTNRVVTEAVGIVAVPVNVGLLILAFVPIDVVK
jgi:hypothetical protein